MEATTPSKYKRALLSRTKTRRNNSSRSRFRSPGGASVGEHNISLGICVPRYGKHISLGVCVSRVGEHTSPGICVTLPGNTYF